MDKRSIIVAHPEKQHSYRLANALQCSGMLSKYITTVYWKKYSLTYLLDRLIGSKFNICSKKSNKNLKNDKIVQFNELRGLILLFFRRGNNRKLIQRMQNLFFDSFGKKVSSYAIKQNVDAVVMYDTNSKRCFELLKQKSPNITRIMDVSIANRWYTREIYEKHIKNKSERENFSENLVLWNEKEMKRLADEIEVTDYFLVPSNFVKQSLIFSGVKENRIRVVPYGVDVSKFTYSAVRSTKPSDGLQVLFVGKLCFRKGTNYLLKAVSEIEIPVNLKLVGDFDSNSDIYTDYVDYKNIEFMGRVSHDQLKDIYEEADVFIIPSLSEGMALVGLEALACGIPIICSKNSGVNDIVLNGYNGYVLEEVSVNEIKKKIKDFAAQKDKNNTMRDNARRTAEKYSWKKYDARMREAINDILCEVQKKED